jgi:hypothetical protein
MKYLRESNFIRKRGLFNSQFWGSEDMVSERVCSTENLTVSSGSVCKRERSLHQIGSRRETEVPQASPKACPQMT